MRKNVIEEWKLICVGDNIMRVSLFIPDIMEAIYVRADQPSLKKDGSHRVYRVYDPRHNNNKSRAFTVESADLQLADLTLNTNPIPNPIYLP